MLPNVHLWCGINIRNQAMACIRPSGRGGTWSPSFKEAWVAQHWRAEPATPPLSDDLSHKSLLYLVLFFINELSEVPRDQVGLFQRVGKGSSPGLHLHGLYGCI